MPTNRYPPEDKEKAIDWEVDYPNSSFTRGEPALWTSWVDVRIEAMALSEEKLFVSGTPEEVPEDDPLAALEGRKGGVLTVIGTEEGKELAQYRLDHPPVFDGMSLSDGKLYLAKKNGEVICFQ